MIRVVGAAIVRDGAVLAALRGPSMSAPGLWELPGGKVEPGESDREGLARELREELGVDVVVGEHLGTGSHGRVELHVYVATLVSGEPVAREHAELRWVGPDALGTLGWAPADRPVLKPLATLLRQTR
ncbi:MAG: (deoxy)nucleoside triphosphate pyrophosphohydrolase [Alphaproteobacteria bacterium]|nr:(deoxy)nucleoside triphosphate pyrophosphohydrolase [Alphaproteobacteria bacterium]